MVGGLEGRYVVGLAVRLELVLDLLGGLRWGLGQCRDLIGGREERRVGFCSDCCTS